MASTVASTLGSAVVSKITGGGDKKAKKQLAEQEMRLAEQEKKNKAAEELQQKRSSSSNRAKSGRANTGTLLSGLETGVNPVNSGKRTSLG